MGWKIILIYYLTGVPIDLVRAMATFVFLWLGAERCWKSSTASKQNTALPNRFFPQVYITVCIPVGKY